MTTILIVDDEAPNREFLTALLAHKGFCLLEARDGAEALALAGAERPDLIIADILMPTMDGYEFVRQLRLDAQLASTVVIFCTADYRDRDAERLARACGVTHLLFKPCEPELVLRTVEAALGLATQTPVRVAAAQFDRDHLRLLTDKLSRKAAELEAVNDRLSALVHICLEIAAEPDAPRLLENVCRASRKLIDARYCVLAAAPEAAAGAPALVFASGIALDPQAGVPAIGHGWLGTVLTQRSARRLDDLEGIWSQVGLPAQFPRARCLLAVPISSMERSYGWLCFGDKANGAPFSDEDERLATILGAQVGRRYENLALYAEARQAQSKLQAQVARLDLLQRITRAIGERQDLPSILQVVIRSLEDDLPIDFGCICLHEQGELVLTVTAIGTRSRSLAQDLDLAEQAQIRIDGNGLSRCVRGEVVYEPDTGRVSLPFTRRLAGAGLRAVVAAPLLAERRVFGVLIAARRAAESFSSSDCEFLRQLSEHVALAAHQAQLYRALQGAYDDLRESQQAVMEQERLRALGQMASGVAHDINNAISPASLYTESLLELEGNLSERARRYLGSIQHAIHDVAQTVARMREFSRPSGPEATSTSVNLNRLVGQVVEFTRIRWRDVPQQHGAVIDVRQDLADGLPDVVGVESEIRDALTNLIFNAVDAMPEGGTLSIRTRVDGEAFVPASRTVQLEVADTGVGMDDDTRRRCLEPFFTTKGERGTGLGLAMVYGMAQRHGAELMIESARGKGTTLRLVFSATSAASATAAHESLAAARRPVRILAVDDDPLILESMQATLQSDGHSVVTADGGHLGIEKFEAALQSGEPFEVVITDLGMPHMDGRSVAAAIKGLAPSTTVMLLTGWGRRMSADDAVPPHVDRVLAKPPSLGELRRALEHVCSAR
ncbi:MAG TPA: response regulator [Steroidobacteraceae bacterium]